MEAAFGEDFSSVRVRVGESKPMGVQGALSAACRESVSFSSKAPDQRSVAHELAHVVQYRRATGQVARHDVVGRSDPAEREAESAAGRVLAGQPVVVRSTPRGPVSLDDDPKKPEAILYTVKEADTLSTIADKLAPEGTGRGAFVEEIKRINGLTSDTIRPGQVLKIPTRSPSTASKETPSEKAKKGTGEGDKTSESPAAGTPTVVPASKLCSGVRPPDKGKFGGKMALTFDDGPSKTNTLKILATLKKHKAPATFFINGKNLKTEDPDGKILRTMRSDGHIVGNHAQTHQSLKGKPVATVKSEITETGKAITEKEKFFRFPYGAAGCKEVGIAQAMGYKVVGWHVDSADWCFASKKYGGTGKCTKTDKKGKPFVPTKFQADIVGLVLDQVRKHDGGIVLFHDKHAFTADILDELLTRLEKEGFTYTTLSDVSVFPLLHAQLGSPAPAKAAKP